MLECVAISFSNGFPQPRDGTWVAYVAGGFFTIWATGEPSTVFTESEFLTSIQVHTKDGIHCNQADLLIGFQSELFSDNFIRFLVQVWIEILFFNLLRKIAIWERPKLFQLL